MFYITTIIKIHINPLTAADRDEVTFLADIYKALFSVYRIDSQFPTVVMFINFIQNVTFRYFSSKNYYYL